MSNHASRRHHPRIRTAVFDLGELANNMREDIAKGFSARSPCPDCGADDVFYLVWKGVWEAAGLAPDAGWFCRGCLAKRLGRQLTKRDYEIPPTKVTTEEQQQ